MGLDGRKSSKNFIIHLNTFYTPLHDNITFSQDNDVDERWENNIILVPLFYIAVLTIFFYTTSSRAIFAMPREEVAGVAS